MHETVTQSLSSLLFNGCSFGIYLIACGGFGAYVADQKGRSSLEGFLFGALLDPIGVVAVGTLPNIDKPRAGFDEEEDDESQIG